MHCIQLLLAAPSFSFYSFLKGLFQWYLKDEPEYVAAHITDRGAEVNQLNQNKNKKKQTTKPQLDGALLNFVQATDAAEN